ncbi:uncharacterized protein LOC132698185 isoform X2 [Cylas formicarius]|uniref:uncharacterized protein LOC132698185 isoform X2 n=1 Tax=Cylas formicarius TaxID=197179 RepID=UPI0029586A43|nr:uncharacterized protein LOC132698185 isoform X2 [Cylas formicarius]
MSDEIQKPKSLMTPLVITAGLIGAVQGLAWSILSLVSILIYEKVIKVVIDADDADKIRTYLYFFLVKDDESNDGSSFIVTSKVFNIFMYLYFVLSLILLGVSAIILWAFARNKAQNQQIRLLALWVSTIGILSVLDFVLTSLFAHDYHKLPDDVQSSIILLQVTYGIVMTLAARGYVLWIINVIFAIVLAKYCFNLLRKNSRPDLSIIDAYTTSPRPPWDLQNSLYDEGNANNFEFTNKGYVNDNAEPIYMKSESFHKLNIGDTRKNNYRNSLDTSQFSFGPNNFRSPQQWKAPQIKTAKIGRQADRRSPPFNVAPPYIPDPDYSPPGSPKVKSVLRPRSHYAI